LPLIRKIIKVGNSRAIVIPASWLRYHEDKQGKITEILMELDNIITLAVEESSESKKPSRVAGASSTKE